MNISRSDTFIQLFLCLYVRFRYLLKFFSYFVAMTTPYQLVLSKDVRLPVQLQRAMAAEAEAAREARAKVSLLYNMVKHKIM